MLIEKRESALVASEYPVVVNGAIIEASWGALQIFEAQPRGGTVPDVAFRIEAEPNKGQECPALIGRL
jgi:hypothetical protein